MSGKTLFLILIALIFFFNSKGQESIDFSLNSEYTDFSLSNYQLGLTPSALLNRYTGLQLSQRIRIYKPLSLRLETTYIFSIWHDDFNDASGFRVRPSIQLKVSSIKNFRGYFGIFYNERRLRAYRSANIIRAGGNFIETVEGHMDSKMRGWGVEFEFDFNQSLRNFSFSIGLGSGRISNDYSHEELIILDVWLDNEFSSGSGFGYFIFFYSIHYRFPLF